MENSTEDIILDERKINKIPNPYCLESTPYKFSDFSEQTRQNCFEEARTKISKEWPRISKVIIIGDVAVGKTCIVNRFCRKLFQSNYKCTIGVDFDVERFLILGVPFTIQIWDTAGHERFKCIGQSYYRKANVIVIVFDVTKCNTLANCQKWLNEAMSVNTAKDSLIFLVGSKLDLLNHFSYKSIKSSATKLAKEMNAEYWGVSSKTGKNINKLFCRLAALSFDQIMRPNCETKNELSIGRKLLGETRSPEKKNRKTKCC